MRPNVSFKNFKTLVDNNISFNIPGLTIFKRSLNIQFKKIKK